MSEHARALESISRLIHDALCPALEPELRSRALVAASILRILAAERRAAAHPGAMGEQEAAALAQALRAPDLDDAALASATERVRAALAVHLAEVNPGFDLGPGPIGDPPSAT